VVQVPISFWFCELSCCVCFDSFCFDFVVQSESVGPFVHCDAITSTKQSQSVVIDRTVSQSFRMPDHLLRVLEGHTASVNAVRLTADGAYCMTASDDRTLRLWNPHKSVPSDESASSSTFASSSSSSLSVPQALCVHAFAGVHAQAVLDVALSVDKSRFVSAGHDKACFLWDVVSSRVLRRIQAHDQRTNAVALSAEGTVLCSASYDATVKLWDLRSQQSRDPIQILTGFTDSVTSVCLGQQNDATVLVAGSVDGTVRTFDLRRGVTHTDTHAGHPVTAVVLSADGRSYLSTCLGGTVRLVDLANGVLLHEYTGHKHESFKTEAHFCYTAPPKLNTKSNNSNNSDISKQDKKDARHQIICGSEDGGLFHWDLLTGQVVDTTPYVHRKSITSIACHPTVDMFLSSSFDSTVKCWSTTAQ
jgi:mitogen-activated protein kinase organizer 1